MLYNAQLGQASWSWNHLQVDPIVHAQDQGKSKMPNDGTDDDDDVEQPKRQRRRITAKVN